MSKSVHVPISLCRSQMMKIVKVVDLIVSTRSTDRHVHINMSKYVHVPISLYRSQVMKVVEHIVSSRSSDLHITRGRKVLEVRPKANWNKGTALNHLLEVMGLDEKQDVVVIYIGDDLTDEDAFKALRESKQGFGVLVTTKLKETAARYTLREPMEVMKLLKELVAWGDSDGNGWHTWSSTVRGDWVPPASMARQAAVSDAVSELDGFVSKAGPPSRRPSKSRVAGSAPTLAHELLVRLQTWLKIGFQPPQQPTSHEHQMANTTDTAAAAAAAAAWRAEHVSKAGPPVRRPSSIRDAGLAPNLAHSWAANSSTTHKP
eukprot:gene14124-20080_t